VAPGIGVGKSVGVGADVGNLVGKRVNVGVSGVVGKRAGVGVGVTVGNNVSCGVGAVIIALALQFSDSFVAASCRLVSGSASS